MNPKSTLYLLLCFFIFCSALKAQEVIQYPKLTDVFNKAEQKFDCSFSYVDNELEGHYFAENIKNNLSKFLEQLEQNTLFTYTRLPDNTITVKRKSGYIQGCIEIFGPDSEPYNETVVIANEFQRFSANPKGPIYFDYLSPTSAVVVSNDSLMGVAGFLYSDQEPCKRLELNYKIEALETVTITNYLSKGISKKPSGGININYDQFDILPGLIESDVLLTLQALPGITSVNETVSYLNIRGGTNDQNLILWDGIKMYQNGHFFGLISALNPTLTSEVTVYKNGTNPEFGDGVSGVIKMEGSPYVNRPLSASASINLLSTDAYVEARLGSKATIQVAGRTSINGLVETPTYSSYFDKAFQNTEVLAMANGQPNSDREFSFYDAHLRFQYRPSEKDYVRFNFLALGNDLNFLETDDVNMTSVSLTSGLQQQNVSAGVFYRREWSSRLTTEAQFYGTSYGLEATNADVSNDQRLIQENDILENGLKLNAHWRWTERLTLTLGGQLNETGITNSERLNNPTFEQSEKRVLRTTSFYANSAFNNHTSGTQLDLGLRVNHISKFNDILIEPRLRFRQRLGKAFWIEALGELKSQTTSQVIDLQNDFLGVENRRWILSDPESFPIIKGGQASLDFTYKQDGLLLSASPYFKKINGITTQSQGFENQFENIRTQGSYKVIGVDFLANKQWSQLNVWGSYSYAVNDYTFDLLTPSTFANNIDLRHSVSLGANYQWDVITIALGMNWHSGRPTTLPAATSPIQNDMIIYGAPNAANIDSYFRVDASLRYDFRIFGATRSSAGLSLWNVLNNNNTLAQSYRLDNGEIMKITDQSLAFTPNLFFRFEF